MGDSRPVFHHELPVSLGLPAACPTGMLIGWVIWGWGAAMEGSAAGVGPECMVMNNGFLA